MYYKLDGHNTVPMTGDEFATAFSGDRTVGLDIIDGVRVSTVFLALDHGYGDEPPLLFETMIFGGKPDDYQERYSTWEEAEAGHKRAVALVSKPEADEYDNIQAGNS